MSALLGRDNQGNLNRKAGVMGIVTQGGSIACGDHISVTFSTEPFEKRERV